MRKPYPCRRCVAEAMVETRGGTSGLEYIVQCSAKPMEHQSGPHKSRDKAIRIWNEMQEAADA